MTGCPCGASRVPLALPEAQLTSVPGRCPSEAPELLAGTPFTPPLASHP